MLLNLSVLELKNLQIISIRGLRSPGLREEIHDLAIWVGLLDILVIEIDHSIPIWEYLE